ncbi:hypothetical protein BD770DRAFT_383324 [Pilaira anomala]|nr:hypothetical protein BD770DRAFT_383324 [Pilaira anomala]
MSGTDLNESQSIKQYLQHQRRLDLLRETTNETSSSKENNPVPQYILDARNEVEGDIEIIYLSSDDDDDDEEEADNNYDSDDSFHTANSQLEDVMMEIDHGLNDSVSQQQPQQLVNESTSSADRIEVIEISSDDSDVEFLYEVPRRTSKRADRKTRKGLVGENSRRTSRTVYEDTKLPSYLSTPQMNQPAFYRPVVDHRAPICSYCGTITSLTREDIITRFVRKNGTAYCVGCWRFRSNLRGAEEERDAIRWFITGMYPTHDQPRPVGPQQFVHSLQTRRNQMVERVKRRRDGDGSDMATTSEILGLCVATDFRCVITGQILYPGRGNYWSLSIDHRIPIKESGGHSKGWSIDNLQLMCRILNTVKGHFSDEVLKSWYVKLIEKRRSRV